MATNVPVDLQYFYEDVVYRVDKRGNIEFGIVMENDDQDMSESSSDSEESPKRKKGEIRVVWHPSGVEELVNSKKVYLADRTLMPGDVVRRMIKGKDTQRGYCRDIELTACVQVIGTKQVLTNIKSEDLTPLEEFGTDIAVCMDSWVGGIRMVHFKLWLATPDGSQCVINEMDAQGLANFEERRDSDNDFPHSSEFYPGQCLWGPIQCLEDAEWIVCTKEMMAKRKSKPQKKTKVIVQQVEADWVGVHWQCRAYSKDGAWSHQMQPKFLVEGDDLKKLKLLNVFEPSTLQVGDRDFYLLKGNENIITREQWRKQQREVFQVPKHSPRKSRVKIPENKQKDCKDNDSKEKLKIKAESKVKTTTTTSEENNKLMLPTSCIGNDSSDDWDTEDTASQSDTASMSSGGSSMSSTGKKKTKGPALMTKVLKKKKLIKAKKKVAPAPLITGSKIVVETLSTNTRANVVWQDGSVELGIPSTQLYPIHHLDDKEFFPGDFVIDQKEESRMYGVVQSVDHQGRTAKIKWFRTYTSSQSPQPTFLQEREVSVYDLKDHPDFQYRPGTLVIRIANFEGEDAGCTAGQVLDNYPEGRVKVWWVDGHVSMCWPQDLYKVGEYDSDEGELWDEVSSDASWETELEDCFIADNDGTEQTENIKPKLAAHIEKARIAMSRLEEIFTQNPALQTTEVMRKLLEVYKDCRYMDKLMGTSFFHESNFQGLLERVRERGRANVAQRVADQVNRLFTHECGSSSLESNANTNSCQEITPIETKDETTHPEDSGLFSAEISKKESGSSDSSAGEFPLSDDPNLIDRSTPPIPLADNNSVAVEQNKLASETFINCHVANSHVCVKLCTLIKAQLVLAHAEVSKRFGLSRMSLSDATKTGSPQKISPAIIENDEKLINEASATADAAAAAAATAVAATAIEIPQLLVEMPIPHYTEGEGFSVEESAPDSHKFKLTMFQPTDPANFFRTVSKELKLLRGSLPPGIWVKGFEDRIDLYSVMFRGPEKTPYEDGLFLFDFQLSADYPAAPPLCHYISYCSDRLNPNLYEDGKVCVSLLGTWAGRGTELWTSSSTLLQVIVSIQGLILVSEPYFNEAGFEKQRGSQQGRENSRMYNEMVVLKLVQAQTKLLQHPPSVFKEAIVKHFEKHVEKLLHRLDMWMEISEHHNNQHPLSPLTPTTFKDFSQIDEKILPQFPLVPASRGFCITLRKTLAIFKQVLVKEGILPKNNSANTHSKSQTIVSTSTRQQQCVEDKSNYSQSHLNETKKELSERSTS
ncbi:(E3-independent) E2 ubiquitin-conjugating enzyme UBE2O [Diachasma alloeum]|uniref:(E3-independent) E2 ubiquitin-conjugating enzyme UBE2O n=1 Tax=Diachasma alloeum TaxID=454923 RepID=UPI000738387D|nr:(E3-independent) E2 ubiquitin-conjugating enzyme UBE2O [Diachasma alloeum]XP_015108297.1 (E3-independent) E2 ubiquitin-conjugating enzyme UBE2O [Diachasma alloeum]XP_015108298.1 (E3-independent) E2 ubiquitin-conjugating enzyme UBE2O [Diachasma alloeum]XP_015108299.1 (E3-independent) E2 ubiquitin-conjugating enzyme UBE2O [Diachasma alloeum]